MSGKKVICFGEVLWDSLPKGIYLGGAPLNVALNLNNLGIDSTIISAVGKDRLAGLAIKSIKNKGLDTSFIQVNDHPSGLAEVDIDEDGIPSYTIHENTAWDFIEITDEIKNKVSKSDYIVFGTLAFRNTTGDSIRELLKNYEGKVVVDVNLRNPFYTEELVDEVISFADIVKVNEEELQQLLTWKNLDLEYPEALKWISETYDVESVLLSRGEKGAYIYSNKELSKKGRYYVKVRDTVGAGDAFLAATIYSFIKGENPYDTICFANAVGAFVASRNGATPVLNMAKIEIYLKYGK